MDRIKLSTKNVSIEFPGVKALEDINFEVSTGEIRAVVGANGAGKSTLMKVLSGANPTYTGEVLLNDKDVELRTPVDAKKCGVQIVYQEVDTALFPNLTVAENIIQGDLVMDKGNAILNWGEVYKEGRKALDRLHISKERINERDLVSKLSLADKQMVLIAKAIRRKCNFLILDEPTAPLSNQETKELFEVVEHLHKTENIAILFISHRLNEILEICESYTVMRNGKLIGTYPIAEIKNATYSEINSLLGESNIVNFSNKVTPSLSDIQTFLKPLLSNTKYMITYYSYKPLLGMMTKTDPNGVTTYFDYDSFGRLYEISDHGKHTVTKYHYQYKH